MPTTTYRSAVRSFDHSELAGKPSYPRLREALADLANESDGMMLAPFLEAVRDMTLSAPYADHCDRCTRTCLAWPHRVNRDGDWLTCWYRCSHCHHEWTCGYSVATAETS